MDANEGGAGAGPCLPVAAPWVSGNPTENHQALCN